MPNATDVSGRTAQDHDEKEIVVIDHAQDPNWDAYVRGHERGWVSHLGAWKTVLEESFPHLRGFCITLQEAGRIRAALPIFEVGSGLTGNRLVSVPFATLFEPLWSNPEDIRTLLDAGIKIARQKNAERLEIRFIGRNQTAESAGAVVSLRNKIHTIALEKELEEIRRGLHVSSVRQMITRAGRTGFTTRTADTEQDFDDFFHMYCITRRRLGLPPQPRNFLHLLWERFSALGNFEIRLACLERRSIAAIALFKFGARVSLEYSVTGTAHRNSGASQLLLWEAIQKAKADGYRLFDLGRTDERNEGLMRFKGRWGAVVDDLPRPSLPVTKAVHLDDDRPSMARRTAGRLLSKTPLPMLRVIGNLCYRHLS